VSVVFFFRRYCFFMFVSVIVLQISICQATPQELQPIAEIQAGATLSERWTKADLMGDGIPLDLRIYSVEGEDSYQQNIVFEFYKDNYLVARIMKIRSKSNRAIYQIYKAHLRDERHEEIIILYVDRSGSYFNGLSIMGSRDQSVVADMPIEMRECRYIAYRRLQVDGYDLLGPFISPYDVTLNVHWEPVRQVFIMTTDADVKIPKDPPVPAPTVLSDKDRSIGAFTLGISFQGPGGIYDPKTWLEKYKYDDVEIYIKHFMQYTNIHQIIVDGPSFETPRGIKVGDSVARVVEKYGEPFISEYRNLLLYEYATINKPYSLRAVLRFAIDKDSGCVEYISLRYN